MLFEDFTLAELDPFVEGNIHDESLTPGSLRKIFEVVKRINPDFFDMRDRLAAIGRASGQTLQVD